MKKKKYSTEFKREAARMVIIEGAKAYEVAEKLGIHVSLIYNWKEAYLKEMGGSGEDGEMSPQDMAAELALVRKKLARSERINEILKKTVGYFAKDDQ